MENSRQKESRQHKFRILNHPFSVDGKPQDWSSLILEFVPESVKQTEYRKIFEMTSCTKQFEQYKKLKESYELGSYWAEEISNLVPQENKIEAWETVMSVHNDEREQAFRRLKKKFESSDYMTDEVEQVNE